MDVGRGAVQAIKELDHRVGRLRSTVCVLVDVRTPMNLSVLRPVWRPLLDDARTRVRVVAEDRAAVFSALESEGLGDLLISSEAAAWKRWDLSMTADAWNDTALHRCRRRIKFFHGVAGKYDLDDPGKLAPAGLDRFDRLAFINSDRLRRYVSAGVIRSDQAVLVGYPKLDGLVNGAWPAARIRADLGLLPTRQTVLYAPTFSTAGSLHAAGTEIVQALLDTGANVVVKLHDRSAVPHPKHTGGIDWMARLRPFEANPRFALARGADSGPYLSAADALVTDHSTVGFEFALLDRPLVIYDAPALKDAARIDDDKWTLLRSMGAVVDTPSRLQEAVAAALACPERGREARHQAHALFAHAGRATDHALAAVYELLELDAPSVRAGHRDSETQRQR